MGKRIVHINRRRAVGMLSAVLGAPFLSRVAGAESAMPEQATVPVILKGSGEVRIATYGGAQQEAQQRAWYEPFEKATGIKVRLFAGTDAAKAKAMVDTGNVEWDVMDCSRGIILRLMKTGDYYEKIDYSLIDDGLPKEFRFEHGVEQLIWAHVMACRTDAYKGAMPASWTDFWDTNKFPGDRAMCGVPTIAELEFALMAAGVPADKLYPIDIDKALASLDKIKKSVAKWWTTGAQPPQLLIDREVPITTVWNGRMTELIEHGAPVAINWNQGLLRRNAWGVLKGAKNKSNAMKFIAYSLMPIPQARYAMLIDYGNTNPAANKYIPPERLAKLPSAPEIQKNLVFYNEEWWVDNVATVQAKFSRWLLG
ncbi:putative spermidine/putrescine transport system substrate-binding protein [Bradyrhizobium sp. JR1.5]|uniref:ABC transporter substrate-binding protein n=1 Tax=unclassified Bradyrhizobium TaxID=2631580 RepID=UPI00339672FA